MKVSRYMTQKLITATPAMNVKQAFLLMRTHRVRHIPVVEGEKLVGIISDRDLRRPRWADVRGARASCFNQQHTSSGNVN